MRIVAFGDAHLGRSYLPVTNGQGLNQRELDFEAAFVSAVEVSLQQHPDVMVWLGDIFDQPRPTYRSYRVAQAALARIRDHGVPLVAISGNHDTPRRVGAGSPYTTLADAFPEVHMATRMQYERFDLPGLSVHAVPQMSSVQATIEALNEAKANRSLDRTNLLLTHPRLTSVRPTYADINEIEIDDVHLQSDLVLLGHYHFHTRVREGMWYAGSTDTFSFADDPDKPKGVVVLDTDTGECRHVAVPGLRPLVTLEPVEAQGLSPTELEARIIDTVSRVPEGAVARLHVRLADAESYRLVDLQAVRAAGAAGLHVKLEPSFASSKKRVQLNDLQAFGAQWDGFLQEQELKGFDRPKIKAMGDHYLNEAREEAG